jgi:shikimate dehydrogenase
MSERFDILAVAGRPVLHSGSPRIFRELFRMAGKNAAYTRVAAKSAAEAISLFRALGMRGMNLTAPFKEEAASALAEDASCELSDEARRLGAINCLVPLGGDGIRGDNTDPSGVLGALRFRGIDVAGSRCLVLGAGGAGKAAATALISAGAEVTIANRTRFRADEVAALLGCSSASLGDLAELARSADLVASTIVSDILPEPESWFPPRPIPVLDADYKAGALARYASSRGSAVATGADWLLSQALPAYRLFMGEEPPVEGPGGFARLASFVSEAPRIYGKDRKVALVGLMGAGKTMAGRALAERMGLPFVDVDAEIEAEAGLTIPGIFAREGESSFRSREARVIDRITSASGAAVVSTGGGAPAFPAVAAMLVERCLPVWLYVSPRTAAGRAGGSSGGAASRPLLAGDAPEAKLAALEAERRGAYASCAELIVSTEGRGFGEVAEIIHEEISRLS